jgi:hypothetical protein
MTSISPSQGSIENQNQYNRQNGKGISQLPELLFSLEKELKEQKKEMHGLDERISDLAVGIGIMEESVENVHKSNVELESKIEQIKDDMKRSNSCLPKNGYLCIAVILLTGAVAAAFFPAFTLHIVLATGGCIIFTFYYFQRQCH